MTAARLLDHFDCVAQAPGAVPRLRRFILDLAVRGALVAQDPDDEPASNLLKMIGDARKHSERREPKRRDYSLDQIDPSEIPFGIPERWAVARMEDLAAKLGAGSTPLGGKSVYQEEGVLFLRSQNVHDSGLRLEDVARISPATHARMSGTHVAPRDILLNITGASIGRSSLVPETFPEANVSQHVAIVRLHLPELREFIHLSLISPFFQQRIDDVQVGVSREGLSMQRLRLFPMLIPPLAEQTRIVTRVNELMALCDRLEAAQTARETRHDEVVVASLQRVERAPREQLLSTEAGSFVANIRHLTTRQRNIEDLRGTLLELAVTGRLVAPHPKDGRAETLLRRLPRHQEQNLVAPLPPADGSYVVPELPGTWSWSVVDGLASGEPNAITDGPFGANLKTEHYVQFPGFRVIRLQNIGRRLFRDEHRSYIDGDHFGRLAKHHVAPGDLVVAGLVDPFVRCCRVPADIGPALVKADCYRFSVHRDLSAAFVEYYLNSGVAQRFAAAHHHGMTLIRIGLGNFRRLPVPIPPLAEQHRIVAKVNELMAVCDRLEAQIGAGEATSSRLLDALLHEALAGSTTTPVSAAR